MSYSFITHLSSINRSLTIMCGHLDASKSEFRHKANMARDYLKGIEDTYHEVLTTDAGDNKTYSKPTIVENK